MKEQIREYWDERAKQYWDNPAATTKDVYLRELEITTIVQTLGELLLPEKASLLDVGCGDGFSTLRIAQEMKGLSILGIDYSDNMIKLACQRLEAQPDLKDRVEFRVGDVMELDRACSSSSYDVVLSDRCLINLDSFQGQCHAIAQIAERAKPRGYYVAIENFIEGHENMNSARCQMGLPEIPVRWHNLYFKEREFIQAVEQFFQDITFKDFSSSYYFATRVIYSAMCQMRGETPDYQHEIHKLAVNLPQVGQFSPIRMAVMRRKLA